MLLSSKQEDLIFCYSAFIFFCFFCFAFSFEIFTFSLPKPKQPNTIQVTRLLNLLPQIFRIRHTFTDFNFFFSFLIIQNICISCFDDIIMGLRLKRINLRYSSFLNRNTLWRQWVIKEFEEHVLRKFLNNPN